MQLFDCLVVENNVDRRNRLKTVVLALTAFKRFESAFSLKEALEILGRNQSFDVIFLAADLGDAQISDFVKAAKTIKSGEDSAYVTILKGEESDASVAKTLLSGSHGFLKEPYSADSLQEITRIAQKVKTENSISRKKAAAALLISSIIREYDRLVSYMSKGLNAEKAQDKFRESCKALATFQEDQPSFQAYLNVALDLFEKNRPTDVANYGGASKRLRERMEAKLKEQYEKEFGGAAPATPTKPSA